MANGTGTPGPGERACAECGKPTTSPKFCGRSCAAKFNNRASPKRKPEGRCGRCGAAIPTSRTVCDECRAAERDERENLRAWLGIDGSVVRRPIARVCVHDRRVFDPAPGEVPRFGPEDGVAEFLEELIGLCFSRPPYLQERDAHRYASLIDAFAKDTVRVFRRPRPGEPVRVADLRLRELFDALENWVHRFFDRSYHPLMLTYAIDAAEFVASHAAGDTLQGRDFLFAELRPMVAGLGERRGGLFGSTSFKKEVTQNNIGGVLAAARVPVASRILGPRGDVVAEASYEFAFRIGRCHLSTGREDRYVFSTASDRRPDFDIAGRLLFWGDVLLDPGAGGRIDVYGMQGPREFTLPKLEGLREARGAAMELPASWITHVLAPNRCDEELLPVPRWNVEGVG